jgi:TolA-binding protein
LGGLLAAWLCLLATASSAGESADSLATRVVALADRQQFSDAGMLLATLAEDHAGSPARVAAVLYASERAYAAGNRPQADAWLKPLAEHAPQQFQSAIADAIAWCKINPSDLKVPSARLLEVADQHGSSSFALAALQLRAERLAAANRPDEAIFVYHALIAQFPKSRLAPAHLLSVARLHHGLNQQREAWDYLQRLMVDYPQSSQTEAALYLGAQVAQQLKNEQAAVQFLEQLAADHERSPYWPDAVLRLAEHQLAAGETTAANGLAERLLQSEQASPDLVSRARLLLLRLAVSENNWSDVEARSQELLGEKPVEPMLTLARFWQAEAAYRRGEQSAAYSRFVDLSVAIAGRKEDWLGVVPLRLAQIEAQRQKWSTAVEWAEIAARDYPQFLRRHEVDYVRGRSLAGLARFDEAREALLRVTTSDTASRTETAAMAQWLIGETFFQQRRYERAIGAYEQTLTCGHPQWRAAALLQAAKCCEQLGRWSDAVQRYEQLLRDHGNSRYFADARSRLEKTRTKVAAQTMTETTTR